MKIRQSAQRVTIDGVSNAQWRIRGVANAKGADALFDREANCITAQGQRLAELDSLLQVEVRSTRVVAPKGIERHYAISILCDDGRKFPIASCFGRTKCDRVIEAIWSVKRVPVRWFSDLDSRSILLPVEKVERTATVLRYEEQRPRRRTSFDATTGEIARNGRRIGRLREIETVLCDVMPHVPRHFASIVLSGDRETIVQESSSEDTIQAVALEMAAFARVPARKLLPGVS